MAKATFAAGCFWGVEAMFSHIEGVTATQVGYCGGETKDPTYERICAGDTGHAEAVEVDFDPALVSYESLLEAFWDCHDPTTLNRQGPDAGTQYRSAIFCHGQEQEIAARKSKQALDESGRHRNAIVTEITAAQEFTRAEDHHQQYFDKRGVALHDLF